MAAGMKHDHSSFAGIGHNQPCRLCSSIDRDGLIEQLAAELWESRQVDTYVAWADAGDYWQRGFRELAETAVDKLSAPASCLAGG